MPKVTVISALDAIRTEEQFREIQRHLRETGRDGHPLLKLTFAEFRGAQRIDDVLRERIGMKPH